ncbi:hypothetical protein QYF36_002301 [Acer negundo]|nr:hypothetical protein QYF36_002301 [Acer negundo]
MQAALQAIEIALANGWRWLWMETDSIAVYFCFILQAIEIALANDRLIDLTTTINHLKAEKEEEEEERDPVVVVVTSGHRCRRRLGVGRF